MKNKENHRQKQDDFQVWLKKQMKIPEFRKNYEIDLIKFNIGLRIIELRKKAGLTQAELAKRVGVTQGFIAQLEMADTENYELKTLKKIAEAIGMVLVIGFVKKNELKQKSAPMRELVHF